MTDLYLDCEFNGHHSYLISIALYNPKGNGFDFYEVENYLLDSFGINSLQPWVRENVVPVLNKTPVDYSTILANLQIYISKFDGEITIYADWPEDFVHLCNLLYIRGINGRPPRKIIPEITMKLITTPDTHLSKIPHNALEDAKALYLNHLEMKNV